MGNSSKEMTISIHDLLMSKGLPPGLIPKDVKSYSLSENGLLEVFLERPCLTKFDTMALYESRVSGNLTYGGLTNVEGFSQEELFLWLPVKDIILDDPNSGIILFDIGVAQKQLSLSLFEDPPDCKQNGQFFFSFHFITLSLLIFSSFNDVFIVLNLLPSSMFKYH